MPTIADSINTEISLSAAALLTGKSIKTMQRWCDEGKIPFRIIDKRDKKVIAIKSILPFTPLLFEDAHLIAGAANGDAESQNELGLIYLEAKQFHIAFYWFQSASKKCHADAMHYLSIFYQKGNMGVKKDEQLSLNWLSMAAANGHVLASNKQASLKKRTGHWV